MQLTPTKLISRRRAAGGRNPRPTKLLMRVVGSRCHMFRYSLIITKKTGQSKLVRDVPFRALSSDLAELPVAGFELKARKGTPRTRTGHLTGFGVWLSWVEVRARIYERGHYPKMATKSAFHRTKAPAHANMHQKASLGAKLGRFAHT